eukprot:6203029-Pleurochrysis_carterae.AAC.1
MLLEAAVSTGLPLPVRFNQGGRIGLDRWEGRTRGFGCQKCEERKHEKMPKSSTAKAISIAINER